MIQNINSVSSFQPSPTAQQTESKNDTSFEDFQALLLKQIYLKSLFSSVWDSTEEDEEEEEQTAMINTQSEASNDILIDALSKNLSKEDVFRLKKYFEERHPKVPL